MREGRASLRARQGVGTVWEMTMRPWLPLASVIGLLLFPTGCLTDFNPLPGDRTQTMDGAGAKVFGMEAAVEGVGCLPDPYTVSQLASFDNRLGDSPSPMHPVTIENAANDGFGAFSRDGVKDRDGHSTLNHKGVTDPDGTLHIFRRSVLAIDTAPGCQGFDNIVRDNSGMCGAGMALCFKGDSIELIDSQDLPLQDSTGGRIGSVDDLMGLLVRGRLNDGDTSMDLRLQKISFADGDLYFHEPLRIHMGNARLFNFKLSAGENMKPLLQLIHYLEARGTQTNEWFHGFTLDFGEFSVTLPDKLNISFNMERMLDIERRLRADLRKPNIGAEVMRR